MLNCWQRAGSNQESKRFHFAKSQLQNVSDYLLSIKFNAKIKHIKYAKHTFQSSPSLYIHLFQHISHLNNSLKCSKLSWIPNRNASFRAVCQSIPSCPRLKGCYLMFTGQAGAEMPAHSLWASWRGPSTPCPGGFCLAGTWKPRHRWHTECRASGQRWALHGRPRCWWSVSHHCLVWAASAGPGHLLPSPAPADHSSCAVWKVPKNRSSTHQTI